MKICFLGNFNKNMDFFINNWIFFACVLGLGVLGSLTLQSMWLMRALIASYISLCVVMLVPDLFVFFEYAKIVYFLIFVILIIFVDRGGLFDVNGLPSGRFNLKSFIFSFLAILFILASISLLLTWKQVDTLFISREVYNFLNNNIFYLAIAPILFSLLFHSNDY